MIGITLPKHPHPSPPLLPPPPPPFWRNSCLEEEKERRNEETEAFEESINKICNYLKLLSEISNEYKESICKVDKIYQLHLDKLSTIVLVDQKKDWDTFTEQEKLITENTVLLVNLLYNMGKVKLVLASEGEELNKINKVEIYQSIGNAEAFLNERF